MHRFILIAALLACIAFAGPADAALAQKRFSSEALLELQNKVEVQRDAYYRFELAEKEALDDGASDRAEAFKKAKSKAYQEYVALSAKLEQAQAEKREYDKRMAVQKPDW